MGWIDAVVIGIIVISAIIGLSKGLFESILSIFSTTLSLFAAIWASKPVAAFINSVVDLNGYIAVKLAEWGVAEGGTVNILLQTFTVEKAAYYCAIVLSAVVVWILIKIAIWLLARLFDSAVSSNSALSGLNRLLGLLFGAAKGLLIVGVLFALSTVVGIVSDSLSTKINNEINDPAKNNSISRFVYSYVHDWTVDQVDEYLHSLIGQPENPQP